MHVKRGDTVKVLWGKDAGKTGRVLRVYPKTSKVLVEHLNVVKRHSKPTQDLPQGGVVQKELPMAVAKVRVVCEKCHKPTRVRHRSLADGKKVRVCGLCREIIDKVS